MPTTQTAAAEQDPYAPALPTYSLSYEIEGDEVGGRLLAVDINGHGHDLDLVELLLNAAADDLRYGRDDDAGDWEVTESWRRTVPMARGGGRHVYQDGPSRGAKPVTHVELCRTTDRWCISHIDTPAPISIPAERITHGERAVERELARAADETDSRATVQVYPSGRSVLHLCQPCAQLFFEGLARIDHEGRVTVA